MLRRLIGIAGVALVVALALTVDATAAPATHVSTPVSLTLTPDACPQLTAPVTLTGTQDAVSHSSVNGKGVTHIVINTSANGTATDTLGGSYRFNYHNSTKIDVQPGGLPADALTTDHFNLVGNGSANQLHTHFVLRVHVAVSGDVTLDFVNTRGNPGCDPI